MAEGGCFCAVGVVMMKELYALAVAPVSQRGGAVCFGESGVMGRLLPLTVSGPHRSADAATSTRRQYVQLAGSLTAGVVTPLARRSGQ